MFSKMGSVKGSFLNTLNYTCIYTDTLAPQSVKKPVRVTPKVSPAPWHSSKTPTTAELYRKLGLVPPNGKV